MDWVDWMFLSFLLVGVFVLFPLSLYAEVLDRRRKRRILEEFGEECYEQGKTDMRKELGFDA